MCPVTRLIATPIAITIPPFFRDGRFYLIPLLQAMFILIVLPPMYAIVGVVLGRVVFCEIFASIDGKEKLESFGNIKCQWCWLR